MDFFDLPGYDLFRKKPEDDYEGYPFRDDQLHLTTIRGRWATALHYFPPYGTMRLRNGLVEVLHFLNTLDCGFCEPLSSEDFDDGLSWKIGSKNGWKPAAFGLRLQVIVRVACSFRDARHPSRPYHLYGVNWHAVQSSTIPPSQMERLGRQLVDDLPGRTPVDIVWERLKQVTAPPCTCGCDRRGVLPAKICPDRPPRNAEKG